MFLLTDKCCKMPVTQTAYMGGSTNISCQYPKKEGSSIKYFCKTVDEVSCDDKLGRFSLKKGVYTLSITDVSEEEAGTYWCGVKRGGYITLISQVQLQVEGESKLVF